MREAASSVALQGTFEKARALLEAGRIDDAYELIATINESEQPAAMRALRQEVRDRMRAALVRRFAPGLHLRRVEGGSLRSYPLSARDAFVWNVCGTGLSLDDVFALTPLDELDCLRSLAKLADLGLIIVE